MSPDVLYPAAPENQAPRTDIAEVASALWANTSPCSSLMWSVWPAARPDQEHVAFGGCTQSGSWGNLCRWVEREHAGPVYAKGRGPQWAPVANVDGHRCIESTTAVYALTLDCDGAGDWDKVLAFLDAIGAAYLAYRSPGYTPELPKWRLVLPFEKPLVTQRDPVAYNKVWNGIYDFGRIVLGTLAGFDDPDTAGFDPAPKSIANIFYLGHRRSPDLPVREVRWRDGLALDGDALLAAAIEASHTSGTASTASSGSNLKRVSLSSASRLKGSHHVTKHLPPDTPITLTSKGKDGVVAFGDITEGSHCLCPEHGGSGGGSAWVTVSEFGPAVHCCQCNGGTTWFPGGGGVTLTDEEIDALLDDHDDEATKVTKGNPKKEPITPEEGAEEKLRAEGQKKLTPEQAEKHERLLAQRKERHRREQAERLRPEDAGRAVEGSKKWMPIVWKHLRKHGMVPLPCGFKQVLRGRRRGRLHHRDCGKASCLKCATQRIALKLGAIEYMPLWEDQHRGTPMGHRALWIWETSEAEQAALLKALKRSVRFSANRLSLVAEKRTLSAGDPCSAMPANEPADHHAGFDQVDGYVMFRHADGNTITVIATTPLARSRVWHGKAKRIPVGKLSGVLEDLLVKCVVPKDEAEVGLEGVEFIGYRLLRIDPEQRSITSSRTLSLDPETLWRRASKSEYTVAHPHGAKPEVVARWWKETGVLKAMQAAHQTADGKFAPGFAQTVTIDDPVLLDRVLALAAEDADAEAIMAAMLAEAAKAKAVGAEAPTLEEFIEMLAA